MEDYADGVWLVDLASVTDSRLLPQEVANSLSVRERTGELMTQTLTEILQRRQLLLVLDNCEHLANALRDSIHAAADFGAYVDARVREKTVAELRRCVGDEGFARAWDFGQRLPVEQAIAQALSSDTVPDRHLGKPSLRLRTGPLTRRERDVVRLVAEGAPIARSAEHW